MASLFDIYDHVQKQGEIGRERGTQQRLGSLYQQAMTAPREGRAPILGQVAQAGGLGALKDVRGALDGQDEDINSALAKHAQMLVMAPPEQREQIYATVADLGRKAGYPIPDGGWDERYIDGMKRLAGIADKAADNKVVGDALVGPDGRVVYQAQPKPNYQKDDDGNLWMVTSEGLKRVAMAGGGMPQHASQGASGGGAQVLQDSLGSAVRSAIAPLGGRITAGHEGGHNPGSRHGSPDGAYDIGMGRESPEQQAQILASLQGLPGIRVRDERQRPPGQKVWTGPHLHVERVGAGQSSQAPQGGPTFGRKAPATPAGYRATPDGNLTMIPGGPAEVQAAARADAAQAKAEAAAARKAAEEAKNNAKQQEANARLEASRESADSLIAAIDDLTKHEGFEELGSAVGDLKLRVPLARNAVKDADAKLKNIAGQVALATLSKLKTLSSAGATGFGALSAPELTLVQNSIATLQSENISNAEIKRSLKVIRDTMEKTTKWKPGAAAGKPGRQVKRTGTANGRKVVEYSDGTIDYAD